ncbi:double-cubane-cluster-containing anaerobic reductase [Desulforhabdus sp. TSK]|uniref:double-cubane-cluster-containing anaerobic reductase n=1 Tax=Desulforhabdus sp. TSK TaxID=2925014 RepID=UPI001FC89422|nr:double-cubane-cluster-containing anaerobic reductase [Desulforhabdus sp. TSK]GKT10235.1 2-hydroxyglutaryl-CoA dehydratase [Desulforhabdus sp. TSK]
MRPEIMKEFERAGELSLLNLAEHKESGGKVAGVYCLFAPTELVRAAGAIPVSLCGKKEAPISAAEKTLPPNLCPLIKSSYGYAVTDTCPFFAASDFILGETTCDGKKKMFELMGRIKPLHLMHLPYDTSRGHALDFWHQEMIRLKDFLEEQTGHAIEVQELKRQIKLQNEVRRLLWRISRYSAAETIPLSGLDMMTVMETKSSCCDLEAYAVLLRQLIEELEALSAAGVSDRREGAPRLLLTGCPAGKGSDKVLQLMEECGGVIVSLENCTGIKGQNLLVEEDAADPLQALASRYLQTPCSCMTPNEERLQLIQTLVEEHRVQGVVDLTWQCCHTYNVESFVIKELVEKRWNLPFLHIETDYSASDTEQLRTRIEAFLELMS